VIILVAFAPLLANTATAQLRSGAHVLLAPKINPRAPPQQPEYPKAAKARKEEGTVTLDVYVLRDGTVGEVMVAHSSGFPDLDEAAVRAARGWHLIPGTDNGKPFSMWVQLPVSFKIDAGP
jgi:protein TonB